jgi:undecaprenyl-diphosphatase
VTDRGDHRDLPPRPRPLVLTRGPLDLRAWLLFAAAGLLLAALWSAVGLLALQPAPAIDAELVGEAVARRQHPVVSLARTATFLGDLPVVTAVAVVLAVIARRRSGRWDLGWLATTVIGGALAVTATVKLVVDRARPDDPLAETLSSAFPSGHSVRAAAVYVLVIWAATRWSRRPSVTIAVTVVSVGMIVAIGVARVVLGVHWPTDVLGGWVLGGVWVLVALLITRPVPLTPATDATASRAPPTAGPDRQPRLP